MVSFWPWKGGASSTAEFEKTLSTLSAKITNTQARLERRRSSARRARVLCTLYLSFAYLVYAIVLLLVVGYANLGVFDWAGILGGPFGIYGVRLATSTLYSYRVGTLEARLEEQQAERAKTIQKLKDLTKYDSTLELIEKYGGPDDTPQGKKSPAFDDAALSAQTTPVRDTPSRTAMAPPPTANIQRRSLAPAPATSPVVAAHDVMPRPELEPGADFAPNAFAHAAPPAPSYAAAAAPPPESHWYDRLFDVLLGEDETAAKNRIALVCHSCRLVNGLAPPGTKSLAALGMWKCMACGAANGELDEGRKIVRQVLDGKRLVADEAGDRVNGAAADEAAAPDEAAARDKAVGETVQGPAAAVRSRRGKNKSTK